MSEQYREIVGKLSGLASRPCAILRQHSEMGKRYARAQRSSPAPDQTPPPEPPELPVGKAFVLQLSRDTGPALEPFRGRVEHLRTGRRVRFENFEDFQAAVIRMLSEAKDEGH